MEDASDEVVQAWLESQLSAEPKDLSQRIRNAIDAVPFVPCKADPAGAVKSFVIGTIQALDENNASDVVQDPEKCKNLIAKLILKLEPEELRLRLQGKRHYWSSNDKGNLQLLTKTVSLLAVEVHNGKVARAKIKRRSNPGSSSKAGQTHKRQADNKPGDMSS